MDNLGVIIIIIKQHLSTLSEYSDSSKRVPTGRYAAKPQRAAQVDLNAECDRQQARADPLLFTKRPATFTCPDIARLVHGTTILRDSPNHGTLCTHCGVCTFRATMSGIEDK